MGLDFATFEVNIQEAPYSTAPSGTGNSLTSYTQPYQYSGSLTGTEL